MWTKRKDKTTIQEKLFVLVVSAGLIALVIIVKMIFDLFF